MNRSEQALERFRGNCNCAQAVLSVFASGYGLDEATALKIACPFGGGMARLQNTCGAVTGAFMAIGLARGEDASTNADSKEAVYQLVRQFAERFTARHGATDCLTLLGHDISTEQGRQEAKDKNVYALRCERYVVDAVMILEDILGEAAAGR
jgi:C_GCAxxG_C_C family probable redox protein